MSKIKEMIIEADQYDQEKQKAVNTARVLITFAIYLVAAGTLMEYVSVPVMLKTIGFILTGHAFFFLWQSSKKEY